MLGQFDLLNTRNVYGVFDILSLMTKWLFLHVREAIHKHFTDNFVSGIYYTIYQLFGIGRYIIYQLFAIGRYTNYRYLLSVDTLSSNYMF